MFLFSGTFFPLDNLPRWAQWVAYGLPLTHLVNLIRAWCFGLFNREAFFALVYLLFFSAVMYPLAVRENAPPY